MAPYRLTADKVSAHLLPGGEHAPVFPTMWVNRRTWIDRDNRWREWTWNARTHSPADGTTSFYATASASVLQLSSMVRLPGEAHEFLIVSYMRSSPHGQARTWLEFTARAVRTGGKRAQTAGLELAACDLLAQQWRATMVSFSLMSEEPGMVDQGSLRTALDCLDHGMAYDLALTAGVLGATGERLPANY